MQLCMLKEKKKVYFWNVERQEAKIKELRNNLDNGEAFHDLKERITELERQLTRCEFSHLRYEEVKRLLKEHAGISEDLKNLMNAESSVKEWTLQRDRLTPIIAEIDKKITSLQEKAEALAHEISELSSLQDELKKVQVNKEESEKKLAELQQLKGEMDAHLQRIAEAKKSSVAARLNLKKAKYDNNIYKKLRGAFGKNGIQSLIIEQALPDIEDKANELLYRLSEGKMQLHLETIKDKKTGGTRETLEIIITDDHGVPRSYETYSGGEAFRINFALRIALSQMLAERNGVKIRTLGIDEGFGTQDQEGVQHLIEAIQEIQDDFDKIIVITHLDRLKEVFPVRIEVVKDPVYGSQFTLLEQ